MTRDNKQDKICRREALDWFVRMHDSERSGKDLASFNRWFHSSSKNREAIQQADDIWLASKGLQHSNVLDQVRREIEDIKSEMRDTNITGSTVDWQAALAEKSSRKRWTYARMAIAASVLLMILAGLFYFKSPLFESTDVTRYVTQTGERQTIALEDGSTAILNSSSVIEVLYTRAERRLTLIKGQASFVVAKEVTRPFRVIAGNTQVTAVGTEFDVYKNPVQISITLLEGLVDVAMMGSSARESESVSLRLQPGQQISLKPDERLFAPINVDTRRVIAWREGKMNFSDTPLEQVLVEANRYTDLQLRLGDPALADLEITGLFTAGESKSMIMALAKLHGLKVEKAGYQQLVITLTEENNKKMEKGKTNL